MKASNHFKNIIQAYLDQRAETDILFSFQYNKPEKNIDDCITYILNEVQKSQCNGFADEEIFGMAVHYYDEDDLEIGKEINARAGVNHFVELTEEEKEQARKDAIEKLHNEEYNRLKQPAKKAKTIVLNPQPSLF